MTEAPTAGSAEPTSYSFGHNRLVDIVREVLPGGGSVLDIGCHDGSLLSHLRQQANFLMGIETDAQAASRAARVADKIMVADVATVTTPGLFDVVIMADVLEHLVDPASVLRRAATWLKPHGVAVISMPNVAHWSARLKLARGHWNYEDSGIFDRTHLRFFTIASATALIRESGFDVDSFSCTVPALRNAVPAVALRASVEARIEPAWQAAGRHLPGLLAYQMTFVVRRPISNGEANQGI